MRGRCGQIIFADSERATSISYKWFITTCCLNLMVWKLLSIKRFGCDLPTGVKITTVFGIEDPLKIFFHHSHTQKALPWVKTRRLSHEPSILVQAFDLWTCARKKGMEGRIVGLDYALKRDRSVIFHACAEKSPGYLSLPNLYMNYKYQNYHLCKIWWQSINEFFIHGCSSMPVSYQNSSDHYYSLH